MLVDDELPDRVLEILDVRRATERLDLDRDLLRPLLGRQQPLGPEIHEQLTSPQAQPERVVGDGPPVAHERLPNVVVKSVPRRHRRARRYHASPETAAGARAHRPW
jgi:hypothetical protein